MRVHVIDHGTPGTTRTFESSPTRTIAVELKDGDIENIGNMIPSATLYSEAHEDLGRGKHTAVLEYIKGLPGAYRRVEQGSG